MWPDRAQPGLDHHVRYFQEEYEAHIRDKCPRGYSALLTISIDPAKCTGCTVCARKCPVGASAGPGRATCH